MSITLGELKLSVERIVSNQPDGSLDVESIVNDAGRYLFSMHSWNWRNRPVTPLSYIAPISVADATYTEATKTITKTSGFTNYTFRNSEVFKVSAGTGATTGEYVIASRTSDNAIVLSKSIGAAADGLTDIDGSISFPYCVLPSDFGEGQITGINHRSNLTNNATATSLEQVRWLRYHGLASSYQVYYALSYPSQTATSAAPATPLLEIYPTPTAVDNAVLMLTYKAGWVAMADDDALANIPPGYEYLLKRLVKAFSHEAMSDDNSRIAQVEASPELLRAKKQDGNTLPMLGKLQGGAARGSNVPDHNWNFTFAD